jgi:hypothetical protein
MTGREVALVCVHSSWEFYPEARLVCDVHGQCELFEYSTLTTDSPQEICPQFESGGGVTPDEKTEGKPDE